MKSASLMGCCNPETAVLPDHPTPCELRTHTNEPIPFLIWYPGITPDEVQTYDEVAACDGVYGLMKADEFINEFMALPVKS